MHRLELYSIRDHTGRDFGYCVAASEEDARNSFNEGPGIGYGSPTIAATKVESHSHRGLSPLEE